MMVVVVEGEEGDKEEVIWAHSQLHLAAFIVYLATFLSSFSHIF